MSTLKRIESYPDQLTLESMEFHGYHGVNPEERSIGQRFIVTLRIHGDFKVPGESDNLEDTINYSELYELVRKVVEGKAHNLIESVAETIAKHIFSSFPIVAVTIQVAKQLTSTRKQRLQVATVEIYREKSNRCKPES